jgi:hypothetical protein
MKSSNNYFLDKNTFRIIDKLRVYYFVLFIISFVLTEIGRHVYRPFIYSNHINDFGFADSIGNSGGILVQIFFGFTIINPPKKKGIRLIAFFSFGYIIYEIIQPFLPRGVFDWKDIYGTVIGSILALIIYLLLYWRIQNKVIKKF